MTIALKEYALKILDQKLMPYRDALKRFDDIFDELATWRGLARTSEEIMYSSLTNASIAASSPVFKLEDISDTNISNPINGQTLVHENGFYVNRQIESQDIFTRNELALRTIQKFMSDGTSFSAKKISVVIINPEKYQEADKVNTRYENMAVTLPIKEDSTASRITLVLENYLWQTNEFFIVFQVHGKSPAVPELVITHVNSSKSFAVTGLEELVYPSDTEKTYMYKIKTLPVHFVTDYTTVISDIYISITNPSTTSDFTFSGLMIIHE